MSGSSRPNLQKPRSRCRIEPTLPSASGEVEGKETAGDEYVTRCPSGSGDVTCNWYCPDLAALHSTTIGVQRPAKQAPFQPTCTGVSDINPGGTACADEAPTRTSSRIPKIQPTALWHLANRAFRSAPRDGRTKLPALDAFNQSTTGGPVVSDGLLWEQTDIFLRAGAASEDGGDRQPSR